MRWQPPDHTPDGLRKRLREIERQVADLQRVRNAPPVYAEVEAGGTIPFLVAAADAPAEWKAVAAYQCAGSGDEVTINAAMSDASTCPVLLSPGNFFLSGSIDMGGYGVDLEGAGDGTNVWVTTSAPAVDPSDRMVIRRIHFQRSGSATGPGVAGSAQAWVVEQCWMSDLTASVDLGTSQKAVVRDCVIRDSPIVDTASSRARVESCRFDDFGGRTALSLLGSEAIIASNHLAYGVLEVGGADTLVLGNHIDANASVEIAATASGTAFASNFVEMGAASYIDAGSGTQKPTNGNFSSGGLW